MKSNCLVPKIYVQFLGASKDFLNLQSFLIGYLMSFLALKIGG
jgi:hypothetical protein